MAQYEMLIKHWLHEQPSSSLDEFTKQAAQAAWLDSRYWTNMGKLHGAK